MATTRKRITETKKVYGTGSCIQDDPYKDHITRNAMYGDYLGYPKCCIENFGDIAIPFVMRHPDTQAAAKNGFLPCPAHAKQLLNKEVTYTELINPNRKCTVPFKVNMTHEERVQVSAELDLLG